jgi:hypothetical protein
MEKTISKAARTVLALAFIVECIGMTVLSGFLSYSTWTSKEFGINALPLYIDAVAWIAALISWCTVIYAPSRSLGVRSSTPKVNCSRRFC